MDRISGGRFGIYAMEYQGHEQDCHDGRHGICFPYTVGVCLTEQATKYEETPTEGSQYSQIRDSMYILSVMNQYTIKQRMPSQEAERLLRIALFSDSLQLEAVEGQYNTIVSRRRELAKAIREGRKKGIVPVFISQMWFLFSLAITLESGQCCNHTC